MRRFGWFTTLVVAVNATTALADIQPENGTWAGTAKFLGQSGCPSEVQAGLSATSPATQSYANQQLTFPDPLEGPTIVGDFVWVNTSTDRWTANHSENETTPLGPLTVAFTHELTILDTDHMLQNSTVKVKFPAGMAQMLGTTGPCTIRMTLDHKRTGP